MSLSEFKRAAFLVVPYAYGYITDRLAGKYCCDVKLQGHLAVPVDLVEESAADDNNYFYDVRVICNYNDSRLQAITLFFKRIDDSICLTGWHFHKCDGQFDAFTLNELKSIEHNWNGEPQVVERGVELDH